MMASVVPAFLEHLSFLGSKANFASGFFDGSSVVAFGAAIFLLVRSRRAAQ